MNTSTIGKISIPIYSTEESQVNTKFKLNIPLSKLDNFVLATDILKFTKSKEMPDFTEKSLVLYLDMKYPKWKITSELKESIKDILKSRDGI